VTSIIQSNAGIFKSTPLYQWTIKIGELKAISHLINSESVQEAVGEYIRAYGDIDNEFTEDMFNEDSILGLAMHEYFNKPSAK
jgi:DNA-binding cell septation regulator SpoVG